MGSLGWDYAMTPKSPHSRGKDKKRQGEIITQMRKIKRERFGFRLTEKIEN